MLLLPAPKANGNQDRETFSIIEELSKRIDEPSTCTAEELIGYTVVTLKMLQWPGRDDQFTQAMTASQDHPVEGFFFSKNTKRNWLTDILAWLDKLNVQLPFGVHLKMVTKIMVRELLTRPLNAPFAARTHIILDHACGLQCRPESCPFRK